MTPARSRHAAVTLSALVLAVLLGALMAVTCSADEVVTTTELVDHMARYDGQVVTIRGEAIGDLMVRGVHAWITVNDDAYSRTSLQEKRDFKGLANMGIGVWVPESEGRKIEVFGGYKNKGSVVRLTGIFHRACEEHGGDTDIHAERVEVLVQGHTFIKPFPWAELIGVILLGIVIAVLFRIYLGRLKSARMEE
jgi:hypothetical protein